MPPRNGGCPRPGHGPAGSDGLTGFCHRFARTPYATPLHPRAQERIQTCRTPWDPVDAKCRPHPEGDRGAYASCVVGAGSWGTAFARHLALRGISTTLLSRRSDHAHLMTVQRRNPEYLRTVALPPSLRIDTYNAFDFSQSNLVVLAIPSRAHAATVESLRFDSLTASAYSVSPKVWNREPCAA